MSDKKKKKKKHKHADDSAAPPAPLTPKEYRAELARLLNSIAHFISLIPDEVHPEKKAATPKRPKRKGP